MDDQLQAELDAIVTQRLQTARPEILKSLTHIANGNPLASEPSMERRVMRLQAKADLTQPEARMVSMGIDAVTTQQETTPSPGAEALKPPGPEAIIGPTLDFVGVAFLERGRRTADAVGRVAFLDGNPQGSGFLVAPGLFLTNHHVLGSPADAAGLCVEFDYEIGADKKFRTVSRFAFDPGRCFVTDGIDGLDFTLIALGERRAGGRVLDNFGYIPLSDAKDKHMLGEIANVIQHPRGRYKEIVLRENRLVSRDETVQVLHYIADTEQGSSGSPVFNNDWEAIALHHWGGPYREVTGPNGKPLDREINEGIRISAIVSFLKRGVNGFDPPSREAVTKALALWQSSPRSVGEDGRHIGPEQETARGAPRHNADGSVTWTFPIEISVRAPLAAPPPPLPAPVAPAAPQAPVSGTAEAASWKSEDFSDRGGYEPGFIPGFLVPLPALTNVVHRPARNLEAPHDEDPNELRYHHFSVVMNADRRLAFFTACNIDGSRIKAINREKKTVTDNPTLKDLGVESIGAEGAEASDAFRPDRRILPGEQMNREFYEKQIVAGFPEPTSKERIARIFQKGHITLRGDPAWGKEDEAVAAERDTFFYTNAAPQVGFFNQGSRLDRPGSKGTLRWRAVETYVLRNAVTMRSRVTVFAGPVFDDDNDPEYRFGSQVPMKFWKIAVWAESGELRSIALIADQKSLIENMPESIRSGAEAYADDLELARVSEFLSTVQEIETLTGLVFSDDVRDGDIRAGAGAGQPPAQDIAPGALRAPRRARRPRRRPA